MKTLRKLAAAFGLWLFGPVEDREDLDGGNDEWMRREGTWEPIRDWRGE